MLKTSNSTINFILPHVSLRLIMAILEAPECESEFCLDPHSSSDHEPKAGVAGEGLGFREGYAF